MPSPGALDYAQSNSWSAKKPTGLFVALSIFATFALLVAMLSLLLYRARTQRAPAKALIVQGDERWQGVMVSVAGPSLPTPLAGTLDKSNKYVVSFFLDPGVYMFDATSNGRSAFDNPQQFTLSGDIDTIGLDLSRANVQPPSTRPSS